MRTEKWIRSANSSSKMARCSPVVVLISTCDYWWKEMAVKWSSTTVLAVVALILSSLACSVPSGPAPTEPVPVVEPAAVPTAVPTALPTQVPPAEPPPTQPAPTKPVPTKAAPVEPIAEGATLEIINESGVDIWYIYISPSKSDSWGEDWLGDDIIRAGDTYVITGIPEGVYDVLVEDQDEGLLESWWTVDFAGEMTRNVSAMASLEVTNHSGSPIHYLHISPTDSDVWGDNWLGDVIIEPDMTYTVTGIPLDVYDIQARDGNDEEIETIFSVEVQGVWSWDVVGNTVLPSNAVIRFEDAFVDNRNEWGGTEDEDALYRTPADGEYCMMIYASDWTGWWWQDVPGTGDFVAEVGCRLDSGEGGCGLGVGQDNDNMYWLEVSPYDQYYSLWMPVDDVWGDPLIEWSYSNHIDPSGTNHIQLSRIDGIVSVYVNSVLEGQVASDRLSTGSVMIGGAAYDTGNVEVCLDDLRVWRLE